MKVTKEGIETQTHLIPIGIVFLIAVLALSAVVIAINPPFLHTTTSNSTTTSTATAIGPGGTVTVTSGTDLEIDNVWSTVTTITIGGSTVTTTVAATTSTTTVNCSGIPPIC